MSYIADQTALIICNSDRAALSLEIIHTALPGEKNKTNMAGLCSSSKTHLNVVLSDIGVVLSPRSALSDTATERCVHLVVEPCKGQRFLFALEKPADGTHITANRETV